MGSSCLAVTLAAATLALPVRDTRDPPGRVRCPPRVGSGQKRPFDNAWRWTAHDAKRFKIKMPKEVSMTTQERAYTAPIWYTPASTAAQGTDQSKG